jgi:diacylglycerol kinase (ATP)
MLKTVAIVNPVAGWRKAALEWPRLLKTAGPPGSRVVTWWTEGPRHAETLAARARREGFQRVVAVGGDGTLFEVVNGLWAEPAGNQPSVGIVPMGTGDAYVRNLSLGANRQEQLLTALGEATLPVSAGLCRGGGPVAPSQPRLFLNHLGVGLDARVVTGFRRRRLPFRGTLPYFLAGLRELASPKFYRLRGALDGEPLDTVACLLVAGLGRFFGGGLKLFSQASPQAPSFQVLWIGRLSRRALLGLAARAWAGAPLRHPAVHRAWARRIVLTADPPAPLEAEGELVGRTPLELEVQTEAFQVAMSLRPGGGLAGPAARPTVRHVKEEPL